MIKLPESPDQALRKQIFDLLGWKFEVKDHLIYAIRPDGYHYPSDLFWPNAWKHVPDWPTHKHDALMLPIPKTAYWDIEYHPGGYCWVRLSMENPNNTDPDLFADNIRLGEAETGEGKLARAICMAWINMKET